MKASIKIKQLILAIAVIVTCVPNALALTYGSNITIYDGKTAVTGEVNEDNETEPGMVQEQKWDLEGVFIRGNVLTMIGGFNFINGVSGYPNFTSGDIFISKDSTYGDPIGDLVINDDLQNVNNNFGYEYALSIDWSTLAFNAYRLDPTDSTTTVWYKQNQTGTATSNPWKYVSGGTQVGTGTGSGGGTIESSVVSEYGLKSWNEDTRHYAVSFDISSVFADTNFSSNEFYTHFTMGCGNDNLIGHGTTPVPEPGTMMLLGIGLGGLVLFGKRRMNKKA